MASTKPVHVPTADDDPQALDRMVARDPLGGRDRARLDEYGTPIWALIAYLQGPNGGIAETAAAYQIPEIAVLAALRYYEQNREFIDARILLNSAANDD